ncbi:MAG: NAD(P)/FAD-dependent oxidoreductase [Candidatus Saccharimonadales bacterium]
MADKHTVLIVGGGFGGVKAALELCTDHHFEVTLISDEDDLRYYPSLYHTATGGRRANSSIPLKVIFQDKAVKLIKDRAVSLDRKTKTLTTDSKEIYSYDSLILALGVVTNYFNIPGLDKYSFSIKTQKETERLKEHLHNQLTSEHKPDLNYVIVGAGPTGIELAGSLPGYLMRIMKYHQIPKRKIHIDLIEAAPKLLPRLPKDTSRMVARQLKRLGVSIYTGSLVQGETADSLMVNSKPIKSHTVIWTAGVINNPFFSSNNFSLMNHGKVAVDVYLKADEDIYVIGDNANTPYSGLAQTALYDAKFVAKNLKRQIENARLLPYKPHKPITVIPAGPFWAAVVYGGLRLYGLLGWTLRSAADLIAFHDLEPWDRATLQWLTQFDAEEDCPICAVALRQTG